MVNPSEWIPGNVPNPFVINQRRYEELQTNKSDHLLVSVSVSVSVYCLVFLSNNWTVQEKPPKGPVQGDCTGNIPVSDWLLTHNLRSASSVRNHKGRGEFCQLSSSLFTWQIAVLSLGSRFCLYSRTLIKMCPECIHWKTIPCSFPKSLLSSMVHFPIMLGCLKADSKYPDRLVLTMNSPENPFVTKMFLSELPPSLLSVLS